MDRKGVGPSLPLDPRERLFLECRSGLRHPWVVTGEMEPPLNGPCTRRGGPAACSCWPASWKQVSRATNIYRFSERAFSSYVYPWDSCLTLHTPACSLAPRPYARTHGHTGAHTPPPPARILSLCSSWAPVGQALRPRRKQEPRRRRARRCVPSPSFNGCAWRPHTRQAALATERAAVRTRDTSLHFQGRDGARGRGKGVEGTGHEKVASAAQDSGAGRVRRTEQTLPIRYSCSFLFTPLSVSLKWGQKKPLEVSTL